MSSSLLCVIDLQKVSGVFGGSCYTLNSFEMRTSQFYPITDPSAFLITALASLISSVFSSSSSFSLLLFVSSGVSRSASARLALARPTWHLRMAERVCSGVQAEGRAWISSLRIWTAVSWSSSVARPSS